MSKLAGVVLLVLGAIGGSMLTFFQQGPLFGLYGYVMSRVIPVSEFIDEEALKSGTVRIGQLCASDDQCADYNNLNGACQLAPQAVFQYRLQLPGQAELQLMRACSFEDNCPVVGEDRTRDPGDLIRFHANILKCSIDKKTQFPQWELKVD